LPMSIGRFLTAALCATLALGASAQSATLEQIIKKVQEQQRKTLTLQADFRQEKELALLAKPEVSTGTFVYSRPNSVLWTYAAPKRVQMVIADGVLTTYYADLGKAERIDVKKFEDRIFRYMGASGAIDELARYFDFTFTDSKSKPVYVLDLTPKSRAVGKRVQRIKLWIDKKTYLTNKIEYVEGDGDITRYEFTNIRINEPVPQSKFALQLPSTVKVEQMKIQ
ncbi:MAG TPA: outer membrane lipoprotein carrier protein LolA, partial [Candidatus Synoicihabitans sp.]|nr:outer membrane lipoprotein carrier protein LolA [Candidatus Synoicihabitans sp.]